MFSNKQYGDENVSKKAFSTRKWFANIMGILASFIFTGPLYSLSKETVYEYIFENYGFEALAAMSQWGWFLIIAFTLFLIAKAFIELGLMSIAIKLMKRFF